MSQQTITIERARRGEGPSLVEALTYRHKGHSRADPGKYRPDEEVAAWLARDPLHLYRARLEALGFPATVLDQMERLVKVEVEEAAHERVQTATGQPGWDICY